MAEAAGGPGGALLEAINELKEFLSPEMIQALSPTEGFEATPHTFQATEIEGRWKPDSSFGDGRVLKPPEGRVGKTRMYRARLLTIEVTSIQQAIAKVLGPMLIQSVFPQLGRTSLLIMLQSLLQRLAVPSATETVLLGPPGPGQLPGKELLTPQEMMQLLQQLKPPLPKLMPRLQRAIDDLLSPSSAEIEAVWWADGLEIHAGQAAAKHVRGFGSLFNHQARVELSGVSFGNYFPCSYCVTFTGHVNPVGPTFEEFRGAVRLDADGTAEGLFCERSNRDEKEPKEVEYDAEAGYSLTYKL